MDELFIDIHSNKEYTLTYQLVNCYNETLDELIDKVKKYLEVYTELMYYQPSYFLNIYHPIFKESSEILIGEIIPPIIDDPVILEFKTEEQTDIELLEKITSALLDFANENTDYSKERLVLQIKHIFKNTPDEGINYTTQVD